MFGTDIDVVDSGLHEPGSYEGLHRVLMEGLLGRIEGVLTTAHTILGLQVCKLKLLM